MKRAAVSLVLVVVGCRFDLPQAAQPEAGIDAPPVDAPGLGCPADYAPLPGGPAGHLYLRVPQGTGTQQFDVCRGTSARAYLAVPNDATELMNLLVLDGGGGIWVGIDDRVTEGVYVEAGTGGPATFLPWAGASPTNRPPTGTAS